MRSPLECIEGRYEHAVFTTYALNLHFFEEWVLQLLRAAEARNVVVLVDAGQLGQALASRSLRSAGRTYHVAGVRLGPGVFHPKLILLAGEDGARACVSSANLTVDGQLRNVESALILDSRVDHHHAALIDAADFVRTVIGRSQSPAHTIDAVMASLGRVDEVATSRMPSPIRLVHNLDRPMVEAFPAGGIVAVTPFADDGAAAADLSVRGSVSVITDGNTFAASERFFAGAWTVEARDFGTRRLHGKAYWATGEKASWLLLGSPNLSRQALLQTASQANTELAVVLEPHEPRMPDPPAEPWQRAPLVETAVRRHARANDATSEATVAGAFNAWEDGPDVVVDAVPVGARIDYWQDGAWHVLGPAIAGRVRRPDDVRPYLIRSVAADGTTREAVVHRTDQLRIHRLRPRTVSRAADVVSVLPLDLAGVQALESVLRYLYLLGSPTTAEAGQIPLAHAAVRAERPSTGLSDWIPARPEDEPSVPDIYRRRWQSTPDALLALISGALRLEPPLQERDAESDVLEESLDIDATEGEVQEAELPLEGRAEAVEVSTAVLGRYRNSLVDLMRRGAAFVQNVADAALADLAFQSILALHEKVERHSVEVAGERQLLVERDELRRQKLALLRAYLRQRGGRDPHCLATARAHLATCLEERRGWTPLEWEELEDIAFANAGALLHAQEYAAVAAAGAGRALPDIDGRLRPYADRAAWEGFVVEADERLGDVEIHTDPMICVEGDGSFAALDRSPAWGLIGYGVIAGYQEQAPYAVLVRNSRPRSNYAAHLLICDPMRRELHELFKRGSDRLWFKRTYRPVERGLVDTAGRLGPTALVQASVSRDAFAEVALEADSLHALLTYIAPIRKN